MDQKMLAQLQQELVQPVQKQQGHCKQEQKMQQELEQENSRLKQLYAETALENKALKDLIHRKL